MIEDEYPTEHRSCVNDWPERQLSIFWPAMLQFPTFCALWAAPTGKFGGPSSVLSKSFPRPKYQPVFHGSSLPDAPYAKSELLLADLVEVMKMTSDQLRNSSVYCRRHETVSSLVNILRLFALTCICWIHLLRSIDDPSHDSSISQVPFHGTFEFLATSIVSSVVEMFHELPLRNVGSTLICE